MMQRERFTITRRGLLANGAALAVAPSLLGAGVPLGWLEACGGQAVTVGYWSASAAESDLAAAIEPFEPAFDERGQPGPSRESPPERVVDAHTLTSTRFPGNAAYITVSGFVGNATLADFRSSTLVFRFARSVGKDVSVSAWSCSSDPVPSVGGGCAMDVPLDRSGVLPLTMEFDREPTALTKRLGRVLHGASAASKRVTLSEAIDAPMRRGVYFIAGKRASTGRLPSWRRCAFRSALPNGAPTLMDSGSGDREVDFPYLVIRVDHMPRDVVESDGGER